MSSVVARSIASEPAGYHIAKAGVEQLTRYLAYALGPQKIRVNAVAPGLVDREQGPKLSDNPLNQAVIDVAVPLGRAASAIDIANVVAFLCGEQSAYVTGQVITVDGGLSIREPFDVGRRAYQNAQQSDKTTK
jgi:NAD(P)-dependent dehydrogenase (short-subunit alcohol dehydrogenase family)